MIKKFDISDFVDVLTVDKVQRELVERVKKRRKELKITQKELARRTLMSYASIRRFEQTGNISFYSLLQIARELNCLEDFNLLFSKEIILDIRSNYEN